MVKMLHRGKRQEFEDLLAEMRDQNEKYKALNKQIISLLPGATSLGLSDSFRKAKESYDKAVKNNSIYFSVTIIIIILYIIIPSFSVERIPVVLDSGQSHQVAYTYKISYNKIKINDYKDMISKYSSHTPVVILLAWLAIVFSKRRNQAYRLQQEYAHKESVSSSIESYKKQITNLKEDDEKLMSKLIYSAIETISFNPAKTLDGKHTDKPPINDLLDKKMSMLVNTFLKKQT